MNKVQSKFVCDCLENEHLLTEWESQFINNIADKDENYQLSDKQNSILNRIIGKVNRN